MKLELEKSDVNLIKTLTDAYLASKEIGLLGTFAANRILTEIKNKIED